MTKRTHLIYALVDPRDGRVRYVGKTSRSLASRLNQHCAPSRLDNPHKRNWVRSVLDDGFKVGIRLLEECNDDQWRERETFWIASFDGLTNKTLGGDGSSGCVPTAESRAKMSRSQTGRSHSPETIAKMRGKVASEETRKNISRALMGHSVSAETRAKLSQYNTGRHHTEESKANMRKRRPTEETRRKMREARLGKPLSPEHKANARAGLLAYFSNRKLNPEVGA